MSISTRLRETLSAFTQLRRNLSRLWNNSGSSRALRKNRRCSGAGFRLATAESLEQRLLLTVFQDFDSVTAPALPADWTATAEGIAPQVWHTVAGDSDGGPNRLFVASFAPVPGSNPDNVYDSRITSPAFTLSAANQRLSFRQAFDLEFSGNEFYDGGVLEIAVGGGSFTDIVAAGGTFAEGGYNSTIYAHSNNPLGGRSGWGGNSNGYRTTTVDLPDSALGQSVQLRWRFGVDFSTGQGGWSIDSIDLTSLGPVDLDPDDQISEAPLVPLNSSQNGNIDNQIDVDLFAFDVAAGQTILFDVDSLFAESVLENYLRIFNAEGGELGFSNDNAGPSPEGGPFEAFLSYTFPTAGRYYVGISSFPNVDYNPITGTSQNTGIMFGTYTLHIGPAPTVEVFLFDTSLGIGETSLVEFFFSEPVTGFDNSDITVENGTLSDVTSTDGGFSYTATFTPDSDVSDATNLITVNNTGYTDLVGNTGTGTTSSPNYSIDTRRPTVTITVDDFEISAGETPLVTFTFSEPVTGFDNSDLTVEKGTLSAVSSSDGGITWIATFTPNSDVSDGTNLITVNNTGYTNAAGNTGTGTTSSSNYIIDTLRPTVTITLDDLDIRAGETSLVVFAFSQSVTGFDNSDITVENGTLSDVSFFGGSSYFATFTPNPNVEDPTNLITVNNTGYKDSGRNTGAGTTSSQNYAIDTREPPTLTNPGGPATFNLKLKQPALLFEQVEVFGPEGAANVAGGLLKIVIPLSMNKKGTKIFDTIDAPNGELIGATASAQVTDGNLVMEVQLRADATEAAVQTFLRGIKFSTKGAGLKKTPRTVNVFLSAVSGQTATLTQTINVRKK